MKPYVGLDVYYGTESGPLAAKITAVHEDVEMVSLCVFGETGIEFLDAEFSKELEEDKWTWATPAK